MFVDRKAELAFLNNLITRRAPGPAQLVLLYGRRRVGKTELLRKWAEESGLPFTYWAASKESATMQRNRFFAHLLGVPEGSAPAYGSWQEVWTAVAGNLQDRRHILILDEVPYAAETDPAFLSALQHAWDQHFQRSNLMIVLCGSHVRTMETLMARQSPLFGRMTGQWYLEPLPFSSLGEFFPTWDAEARIAAYAMVGGIPAYLNWLDRNQNLVANLRHVMVAPGSMFMAEPTLLLYDEVREPAHYMAVLKAIGAGKHTLQEISNFCFMPRTSVNTYLDTLQTLRLVERRLPATVRPAERLRVRSGRYHLSDPYFRFFFRFLAPFQDDPLMQVEHLIRYIRQNLRAFVGDTAFEDLARQWVFAQARAEKLPFRPEAIGSHWSSRVQVDVVALNWQTREILLGECKWGDKPVEKQVVEDLMTKKTPLLLKDIWDGGEAWRPHYVIFGRKGLTPAARTALENQGGLFVDVPLLDEVLGRG